MFALGVAVAVRVHVPKYLGTWDFGNINYPYLILSIIQEPSIQVPGLLGYYYTLCTGNAQVDDVRYLDRSGGRA